jgi:sacsin
MDIHVMTNSLSTFGVNGESSSSKWFISWGSGTAKSIDVALNSPHKGILPLGAVSCLVETKDQQIFRTCKLSQVPFGFYKTSHIFCYLPLPVETQLPVHINGSFAVTPDRRQLACKTTDDKNSFESMWNEALMGDAVCNAYILMLENLMHLNISPDEAYYNLWPHLSDKQSEQDNQVYLQNCIYKNIIAKNPKVFRRLDEYVPITSCTFLDPTLMETKFGPRAFEGCVQLLSDVTYMMKLPKSIRTCFRQAGCDKLIKEQILSVYEFFKRCVFPHLNDSFWNENNTRDEMIQYALESPSDKLFTLLKTSACI